MNGLDLLEVAVGIAVEAHRGQRDRYGAPYILHPLRVMHRVQSVSEQTVAVLHDVVEDTNWTFEQLRDRGFPEAIISAVECLTKRDGEDYDTYVGRAASNLLARRVKIADLEDNMDLRRAPEVQDSARFEKYRKAWERLQKQK